MILEEAIFFVTRVQILVMGPSMDVSTAVASIRVLFREKRKALYLLIVLQTILLRQITDLQPLLL